jgi:hypothetical protein
MYSVAFKIKGVERVCPASLKGVRTIYLEGKLEGD